MASRSALIRPQVLSISSPYQSTSPGEFSVNLSKTVNHIIRYELDTVAVYGVPTTGGEPDYDFFAVGIDQIDFNTVSTDGNSGKLKIFLDGAHSIHTPAESVFKDTDVPESLSQVKVTIRKPDGTIASSSDLSSIHVRIRIYTNEGAGRINTIANYRDRGTL